jgi:hypothetical protein
VVGANSNCLTVSPTANTAYRCRVYTAGCNASVSNCAAVTVNAPAIVLAHPSDAIRCAGGSVTFSAAAAGPSSSYQWQVSTDGGSSFSNISGATGANYSVASVTPVMNDNRYRLQVSSNGCSPAHSNAARLTVHALPSVTLTLSGPAFLLPGQIATLTSLITPAGGTAMNTTWTLNGNTFNPAGNIYAADVEHTGTYMVSASETWADGSVCQSQSQPVTVGVEASNRLFIFPSPNDGRFTVSYYNSESSAANRSIIVYDAKGAMVHREVFAISGPYTLLNIDITPAQRGSYTIVVHDVAGKKLAQGIVIVH